MKNNKDGGRERIKVKNILKSQSSNFLLNDWAGP